MAAGTPGELHDDGDDLGDDSSTDLSRTTRWVRRFPWIVLTIGLAFLVTGLQHDLRSASDLVKAEERNALDSVQNHISRDLERQTSVLLSANALFDASDRVTRAEFAQFIRGSGALTRNPELRAIEWAPIVQGDTSQFIESVRNDRTLDPSGNPDFSIRSEGDRPWMAVVTFIEPMEGNEAAFGFDLTSDPSRLEAIELARQSGEVTVTAPIQLVQNTESSTGMLLIRAVTDSSSTEDDNFLGVALTAFDVGMMIDDSKHDLPAFLLHDLGYAASVGDTEPGLLYEASPGTSAGTAVREFAVAGRVWKIALAEGAIPPASTFAAFVLALPSAVTLLAVTWALYVIGRSSVIAENRAESLTREVRTKNGALEQSNEWLESFTRVASHDLRSPLRAVTSLVEFIREDNPNLDESTDFNLGRIEQRVDRMNTLIDDLLTLSRISESSDQIADVEFQALVDDVLATVDIPPKFSIETTLAGRSSGALAATQFKTCMYNLVDNAVKHHDRRDGHIRLAMQSDDDRVEVSISDDGAGIAPEYLESIFEPFRRLRPDDTAPGSGIGLTTLRRTANNHGGSISVESVVGEGTTFTLQWPVDAAA